MIPSLSNTPAYSDSVVVSASQGLLLMCGQRWSESKRSLRLMKQGNATTHQNFLRTIRGDDIRLAKIHKKIYQFNTRWLGKHKNPSYRRTAAPVDVAYQAFFQAVLLFGWRPRLKGLNSRSLGKKNFEFHTFETRCKWLAPRFVAVYIHLLEYNHGGKVYFSGCRV